MIKRFSRPTSDVRAEYLISDRLSFTWFPGRTLSDPVPDAKTIWLFLERLVKAGAIRACSSVLMPRSVPVATFLCRGN